MNLFKLNDMTKGWFVGDFNPVAYRTNSCEVSIKNYVAGDQEAEHYHRIATEITAVIHGEILMCGKVLCAGDILVLSPGERTSFKALTDAQTVVVKTPGVANDKYLD